MTQEPHLVDPAPTSLLLAGCSVLVIEDESLLRRRLALHLAQLGAVVTQTDSLAAARAALAVADHDFALLDVHLPDGLGTDLLREGRFRPATGVIVMTAQGAIGGAVEAMKLGALDYLVKPLDPELLPLVLTRARQSRQAARAAEHEIETQADPDFFFGTALGPLRAQLERILAAETRLRHHLPPLLITGETGTGKSSLARWLHRHGPRARQVFLEINCSTLPESLAESEFFGHERGAFTDARATRLGLFEAANGGTLFLDELPSLPLAVQAKVLVALEEGQIRRVGGNHTLHVDVRIIAATHRDLADAVAQGEFREDLLHRLDVFRCHLPPLRERTADLPQLASFLLQGFCKRYQLPPRHITDTGLRQLQSRSWPGNLRELRHELERALVFDDAASLDFHHLDHHSSRPTPKTSTPDIAPDWLNPDWSLPESGFSLDDAINRLVQIALQKSDRNVSQVARRLGVTRDFIRYRLHGDRKGGSPPASDTPGPA